MRYDIEKVDQIMLKYENKIKELQYKLNEQELLSKKNSEIEKITKEKLEDEVFRLKSEIAKL